MTNYNQELATEIHNQAVDTHEKLRNSAFLGFFGEIFFGSEYRNASIGLWEKFLLDTISTTESVTGHIRTTPITPIREGEYQQAYEEYKTDPLYGRLAVEATIPIFSKIAEKEEYEETIEKLTNSFSEQPSITLEFISRTMNELLDSELKK